MAHPAVSVERPSTRTSMPRTTEPAGSVMPKFPYPWLAPVALLAWVLPPDAYAPFGVVQPFGVTAVVAARSPVSVTDPVTRVRKSPTP